MNKNGEQEKKGWTWRSLYQDISSMGLVYLVIFSRQGKVAQGFLYPGNSSQKMDIT